MMVFKVFFYQPTFIVLELKVDKGTEYAINWKSKDLNKFKVLPLHGAFLTSIKYFEHKIVMQFNNTTLVAEQNIYVIKTLSAYIIFDLDSRPKIPLRNFTIKKLLVWCDQ